MKKVFISSTSKDLVEYRAAAIDLCERFGLEVIAMEDFTAMPYSATEGSKRKLDDADLYIGIFAHRYGYIEKGYDKSVTEIEFDYAGERSLDRLCFLVDPSYDWPQEHIQTEYTDKLAAFKSRVQMQLIRALFTDVEDFKRKMSQALDEWRGIPRFGSASAVIAKDEDSIPGKTRRFRGRTALIEQTQFVLNNGDRVLLQGFGGMGKTALAAQCAVEHLPVLWIKMGADSADAVFEALARPFNMQKEIASQTTREAKVALMRQILAGSGVNLLLIDDVWNGTALKMLLEAIPSKMKVLVTARETYPLDVIVKVGELPENEALDVLSAYAGRDTKTDSDAAELCQFLGYHAFALEIAGSMMKVDNLTAKELRAKIDAAPHQMKMPLDFAKEGRESIKQLLDASVDALDGETRKVFLAMGAMFAPSATAEILALYFWEKPIISEDMIPVIKEKMPPLAELPDAAIIPFLTTLSRSQVEADSIDVILTKLMQRSLVEKMPSTNESIAYYSVQELAYSYAKAQTIASQHHQGLEACLNYPWRYNEPSLQNFAALEPELDNFMGAATFAIQTERWSEVERLAWNLFRDSKFLDHRGHYTQAIALLEQAAFAAEKQKNTLNHMEHLGHLSLAYQDVGRVQDSISLLEKVLNIAHETDNKKNESASLGNLGTAYAMLGEYRKAIEYYEKALQISRDITDKDGESRDLSNLAVVYTALDEYSKALEYHEKALQISREIGEEDDESSLNLGNIHVKLGEYEKAVEHYEKALKTSSDTGKKRDIGIALGNLAHIYFDFGEIAEAIGFHEKSLQIALEINDKDGEGASLSGLGNAHMMLREYVKAVEFYEKAIAIAREIGDKQMISNLMSNLGNANVLLEKHQKALTYYEQALKLRREIEDVGGEAETLNNIGTLHYALENYDLAIQFFFQALAIFEQIGALHLVAKTIRNIGWAREALKD